MLPGPALGLAPVFSLVYDKLVSGYGPAIQDPQV